MQLCMWYAHMHRAGSGCDTSRLPPQDSAKHYSLLPDSIQYMTQKRKFFCHNSEKIVKKIAVAIATALKTYKTGGRFTVFLTEERTRQMNRPRPLKKSE